MRQVPNRTLHLTSALPAAPVVSARRRGRVELEVDPGKLAAYPTLRGAASILGVDPGTLSRRADVQDEGIRRGNALVLPTELTLRLALHYRRRRFSEVASDLLDLAIKRAPDYVDEIEADIDTVHEQAQRHGSPRRDADAFLREAQQRLPAELYQQVAAAFSSGQGITPGSAYLGDDD